MTHVLGFRFAPRVRDLGDKRIYNHRKARLLPGVSTTNRWDGEDDLYGKRKPLLNMGWRALSCQKYPIPACGSCRLT